MQAKKRYILVFVSCAFLAYCYFGGYRLKTLSHRRRSDNGGESLEHLANFMHLESERDLMYSINATVADTFYKSRIALLSDSSSTYLSKKQHQPISPNSLSSYRSCRMETCFDFSRCQKDFLIYVYPPEPLNSLGAAPPISPNYQKIITAVQESRYHTTNPDRACVFILGIDTLDRDSLSEDYVRNVPSRLSRLAHWNNGRNHVIFNLYSGTWPEYVEQSLGFDTGEAILAKASMSIEHMRPGFDISIPLFHKQFPLRAGSTGLASSISFPSNKKYLLAFKGKRYVLF